MHLHLFFPSMFVVVKALYTYFDTLHLKCYFYYFISEI